MAKNHYLVLARKWRPQRFDDVVGQEHITRTLQNAITSGRIGHAFLFIGSRGIGKTTTARVLAKALNCQQSDAPTPNPCCQCSNCLSIAAGTNIDVMEIDGASNRGIDDAKQIRENVRLVPATSRYKIYIIDEVHQLSRDAFNALLKTLEEPPAHAVFILATTEAHKVPATIVSRCQRYDFRRLTMDRLCALLRRIMEEEGVTCGEDALAAIARGADGGIRDAQSILEQVISYCGDTITYENVFEVLGLVDWQVLHRLCDAILERNVAEALHIVEDVVANGKDLSQFVQDVLQYFRNLLVCKAADPKGLLALPEEDIEPMKAHAAKFTLTGLIRLVEQFAELSKDFDSQLAQRIALEALLIRISKVSVEMSVDAVLEKLVQLGAGGIGGGASPPSVPQEGPPPNPPLATRPNEDPASGARRVSSAEVEEDTPSAESPGPSQSAAPPKRIRLTSSNLSEEWPEITRALSRESLNLGIWLGHAQPIGIEEDTLVLGFRPEQAKAYAIVRKPEHIACVESVLQTLTVNIRGLDCRLAELQCEPEADSHAMPAAAPDAHTAAPNAIREEFRTYMEDPHIVRVVDVFKGRIIDVRHRAESGAS